MTLPADVVTLSVFEVWSCRERFLETLTQEEHDLFRTFRIDKRRREWLAGRVAAKRGVQRALGLPFSRITVRPSTDHATRGRPEIIVDDRPAIGLHLSISHSGDLAVACVHDEPVGIDVEIIAHREPSFEEIVLTPEELRDLRSLSGRTRDVALTAIWCTKEAVAKWLGTGLSRPFETLQVLPGAVLEGGPLVFRGSELCWARVRGQPRLAARVEMEGGACR